MEAAPDFETVETLVKRLRLDLGMTQNALARALGVRDGGFVGLCEVGSRYWALSRLPALAQALGVDPVVLIRRWMRQHEPEVGRILFGALDIYIDSRAADVSAIRG